MHAHAAHCRQAVPAAAVAATARLATACDDASPARRLMASAGVWQPADRLDVDAHGRIAAPQGRPTAQLGRCPASPTCIRMPSSARWPAWPSARPIRDDSFWTWRETMYRFAARFDPGQRCTPSPRSCTSRCWKPATPRVCEFHYLHHAPDGRPYADPAAMSRALIEAARDTGIRLTLLPVLYMTGGFDGRALARAPAPLRPRRRRLPAPARRPARAGSDAAAHRLRAAQPARGAARTRCARCWPRCRPTCRIHIHIAEQIGEVAGLPGRARRAPGANGCWTTPRSMRAGRWCTPPTSTTRKSQGIARSGATVAICPTTEANLGDGLFPLRDYLDAGGALGHRLGFAHLGVAGGGTALARIRPAPGARAAATSRCARTRPASAKRCCAAWRQRSGVDGTPPAAVDGEPPMRSCWMPMRRSLRAPTDDDVVDRWIFSGNRNAGARRVRSADSSVVERRPPSRSRCDRRALPQPRCGRLLAG